MNLLYRPTAASPSRCVAGEGMCNEYESKLHCQQLVSWPVGEQRTVRHVLTNGANVGTGTGAGHRPAQTRAQRLR